MSLGDDFEAARLTDAFAMALQAALKDANVSKVDLAKRASMSYQVANKVLNGESNVTLKTIARLGNAISIRFEIKAVKIEEIKPI